MFAIESIQTKLHVRMSEALHLASRHIILWCKKALRKCSSAFLAFLQERDKRGSPLFCRKSGNFFGVKGSGEGLNPFLRKQRDSKESFCDKKLKDSFVISLFQSDIEIMKQSNTTKRILTMRLKNDKKIATKSRRLLAMTI